MIRWFMMGLLAIGGAWLAAWALSQQGYVAVHFSGWLIETSVSVLTIVLFILATIGYGVTRLLVLLWQSPRQVRRWRERKKLRLPVQRLSAGIQALALNDTDRAVMTLTQGRDDSQWLRLMLAAQLAHAQNKVEQRKAYLAQALALAPQEAFTIRLLQARWLMHEDPAQALVIIEEMLVAHPRQRTLKALRVHALADLGEWTRLAALLPSAKSSLSRKDYLHLQLRHDVAQLTACSNRQALDSLWQSLSTKTQRQAIVAQAYVSSALRWGVSSHFWQVLSLAMNRHWHSDLLPLFAQVAGTEPYRELKQVQVWQQRHPHDAQLWWLSGVLAQRLGILGQAEKDWQHSLSLAPSIPAALALSDLYASQAKTDAARQLLTHQLQSPVCLTT